jgi:hypothetical protein
MDQASATRSLARRRERLDGRRGFRGSLHRELSRGFWRRATGGWQDGGFQNRRFEWDRFLVRSERQRLLQLQRRSYGHDARRPRWWGSGRFRQRCGRCDRLRRSLGRSCGARSHGLGARARNGARGRLCGCLWRRWRRCRLRGLLRRDRFWRIGRRAHRRRLCGGRHGHGRGVSPGRRRGWTSTSNRRRCRGCANRRRSRSRGSHRRRRCCRNRRRSRSCESFRLGRRFGRCGGRRHRRPTFRNVDANLDEVSALATLQSNSLADDLIVGELVLRAALPAKKLHAGRPFGQTLAGKLTLSPSNRRQSDPRRRRSPYLSPLSPKLRSLHHHGRDLGLARRATKRRGSGQNVGVARDSPPFVKAAFRNHCPPPGQYRKRGPTWPRPTGRWRRVPRGAASRRERVFARQWCAASPHECRHDQRDCPTPLPRQPPRRGALLLRSPLRHARFGDRGDLVAGQRELASRPVVFQVRHTARAGDGQYHG